MAESNKYLLPEPRRHPGRLQRRAPSSIRINSSAAAQWNAAIPLLSPLVSSPPESNNNLTAAINLYTNKKDEQEKPAAAEAVLKRWQHPAMMLFCQEQAPPSLPIFTLIDN